MTTVSRSAVLVAFTLCTASIVVGAQPTIAERAPSSPTAVLSPGPLDVDFARWRDAEVPRRPGVRPVVITGGRYVLGVYSPVTMAVAANPMEAEAAIASCSAWFQLSDEATERLRASRPWAEFDAAVASVPVVTLTVQPAQARVATCTDGSAPQRAADALGLHFGYDTISHPANDAFAVKVQINGRDVTPRMIGRVPATKVSPEFVGPDGSHQIRIYLDHEDLAPRDSDLPSIEVSIWNGLDGLPQLMTVPPTDLVALWREFLAWRAHRLEGGPVAIEQLLSGGLGREKRTRTRMELGLGFLALHDTAAASVVIRDALQEEPCLQLPPSSPDGVRAFLNRLRTDGRCSVVSGKEIARLALMPGRAHRDVIRQPTAGRMIVGGVVVGLVASTALQMNARTLHAAYETDFVNPVAAYNKAARMQRAGNILAISTCALWGGSIAHAVLGERQRARRIEEMATYQVEPRRPASVGLSPNGLGLAFHVF